VTVEFVKGGKRFRVEFDPTQVGSIVFNKKDLQRAQAAQELATGEVIKEKFPTAAEFSGLHGGSSDEIAAGPAAPALSPSLWWHTNGCTWVHPDDE
jgi:hypothetical protein